MSSRRATTTITVTHKPQGPVSYVLHNGIPLSSSLASNIQPTSVTQVFELTINDVLNYIYTLSRSQPVGIQVADKLFEELFAAYQIRFGLTNYSQLRDYWYQVWNIVFRWEKRHRRVHKGTFFYWLGLSHLACGDVSSAYVAFFNAIEEDKRAYRIIGTSLQHSPASLTMSLVDDPNNALRQSVVVPIRDELQRLITDYQNRTGSKFGLLDLDKKFLTEPRHSDIKIRFVSTFHELYNLRSMIQSGLAKNDYAAIELADILFNLCRVIDQLLDYKYLSHCNMFLDEPPHRRREMAKALYVLALEEKLIRSQRKPNVSSFLKSIHPDINIRFRKSIKILLDGHGIFNKLDAHGIPRREPLPYWLKTVYLAYRIRNHKAHRIKSDRIIANRFQDIYSNVMDAFFLAVEKL